MKNLHIIMPMAGRGSRFAKAGVLTPKPLIEVDGQPMFLKALSSLDKIKVDKKYTIIIRKEHDQKYNLSSLLKRKLPSVNIVVTDEEPVGAVVDAKRAQPMLSDNESIIIMDCDMWFQSKSYNHMVRESLTELANFSGGLLTFQSTEPRYSYVKVDNSDIATETAEKIVISNHAITGAYLFTKAKVFLDAVEKLLKQPITDKMPEYYISFLYNILIDEGKKIKVAYVDEFASFGTPEELKAYNERQ